jgi:hypothetical protein
VDTPREATSYWATFTNSDTQAFTTLRRKAEQTRRALTKEIENLVRQEFGFKNVGEGWVSETLLFQVVCQIFSGYQVLRHHRPRWLKGLELDIYIPDLRFALEYQQQHFHLVKAWGGEDALDQLVARDVLKAELCDDFGITLIAVDCSEPLTEEHVRLVLKNHLIHVPSSVVAGAAQA